MIVQVHKNIFNPVYLPYLESYDTRFLVFYGGAGSGKSHFVAQRLVYKGLKSVRKILVLRKVNRTTKTSTFQLLLDTISQFGIYHLCRINKTDFTITLPNGTQFICSGLTDPEKIKSITGLTDAWLEEATEFSQDDFSQINLRVRHPTAKNQEIILSFKSISSIVLFLSFNLIISITYYFRLLLVLLFYHISWYLSLFSSYTIQLNYSIFLLNP